MASANFFAHFQAVQAGHHPIHQDETRRFHSLKSSPGRGAILRHLNVAAPFIQKREKHQAGNWIVVDEKNFHRTAPWEPENEKEKYFGLSSVAATETQLTKG